MRARGESIWPVCVHCEFECECTECETEFVQSWARKRKFDLDACVHERPVLSCKTCRIECVDAVFCNSYKQMKALLPERPKKARKVGVAEQLDIFKQCFELHTGHPAFSDVEGESNLCLRCRGALLQFSAVQQEWDKLDARLQQLIRHPNLGAHETQVELASLSMSIEHQSRKLDTVLSAGTVQLKQHYVEEVTMRDVMRKQISTLRRKCCLASQPMCRGSSLPYEQCDLSEA